MNNFMLLARFGHGSGSIALLFLTFVVIVAVAAFANSRDAGTDKKIQISR